MKIKYLSIIAIIFLVWSCNPPKPEGQLPVPNSKGIDTADATNDFYDNEPILDLPGSVNIEIVGEVAETKKIELASLPIRSIIVKETRIENDSVTFTGAYRYDGISLYDLLDQVKVIKKNAKEFNPIIDQYIVVYNSENDSVVFSWGEIYYPVQRHQILIGKKVMRIVPSKTKDLWPLPEKARLVVGSDLITERNITDPVRIAVRSVSISYPVDRSIKMWSPQVKTEGFSSSHQILEELPSNLVDRSFEQVFYGRGMGIHGITKTRGVYMKELFSDDLKPDRNLIRHGLFVIAAIDGYRCSMTYSELMNRNDNAEVMIMDEDNYEGAGRFSCLFTADFFSDRAIKSMTEIRLVQGLEK